MQYLTRTPVVPTGTSLAVLMGDAKLFYVDSGVDHTSGISPAEAVGTLDEAVGLCTAGRGDTIAVMPGHAESLSSATACLLDVAGITVIGMGTGNARPTFTLDTANTATFAVSAANIRFVNCKIIGNFLSIAAAFTLSTAKWFTLENCDFFDTSSVLNFLNIVKSTGAANTVDGLTVKDCTWNGLGTTSVNSFALSANDIDSPTFHRNRVKLARTADAASLLTVSSGVITNADIDQNKTHTLQTAVTNGALVNVGGTTSSGWLTNNRVQTQNVATAADLLVSLTSGLTLADNKIANAIGYGEFPVGVAGQGLLRTTATSAITASSSLVTGSSPVTLFTVTGVVKLRVWGVVTTGLTSTATTGTLEVGVLGSTAIFLAQATANGTNFPTGSVWIDASPTLRAEVATSGALNYAISNGGNVTCTIATNSMTAGVITFYCEWSPVTAGASVVAAL